MALPKLCRAFNMKINCSSDIYRLLPCKELCLICNEKNEYKMFSAYSKELLQILTSKRCIEWPKLYFLLLVKAEHSAMKIKLIFQKSGNLQYNNTLVSCMHVEVGFTVQREWNLRKYF